MRQRLLLTASGFLGTIHKGELYGAEESFTIPLSSSSLICATIARLWICGYRYCLTCIGASSLAESYELLRLFFPICSRENGRDCDLYILFRKRGRVLHR